MKQVVVVCYPNDWHWVLSIEYINSQLKTRNDIEVWDVSFAGETGIRNNLKKLLGGNRLQSQAKDWLRRNNIRIVSAPAWQVSKKYVDDYNLNYAVSRFLDQNAHSLVFNSVVEKVGNLKVDTKKYRKEVLQEIKASSRVMALLQTQNNVKIGKVTTVNGRFTKNATVKSWAKENKIPITLLEFGSSENKFEEFLISPHSVSDISSKINWYWENSRPEISVPIAQMYFNSLIENKVSRIPWRKSIKSKSLPAFPTEKKIAVFFASTESEHAGLGDSIGDFQFASQVEAFRGLIKVLPSSEWHIYLRRHPKNPLIDSSEDPEVHLWKEFEHLPNITIIEPDSSIDSIELGLSSDLVTNYWSTIAIELIVRGAENVVTLGKAPWNNLIPSHTANNESELRDLLQVGFKSVNLEKLYPLGYYYAIFGTEFEVFSFRESQAKWLFN